jgi:lipopolysaccharide export system ATP-binding protein
MEAPVQEGLVVDRIGKTYRGRAVVKGVSLRLGRGEVKGLLGPNGAGKTTCFYMITGLIAADEGAIWLDGENITAQPMYQRARMGLGYLPQEPSIFRGMTVEENVMSIVELREPDSRKARETVAGLLGELRIDHLRKSPAISLSGGERRRVEIARALASEPAYMLLDEPFAGIDPLAIADIREVIGYLKARGIGTSVHWRPLHLHPYYETTFGWRPGDLPVASAVWQRLVSLPLSPTLTLTFNVIPNSNP